MVWSSIVCQYGYLYMNIFAIRYYSGGTNLTVIGRFLDSVANPVLFTTLKYHGKTVSQEQASSTLHLEF